VIEFDIELVGDQELRATFAKFPEELREAVAQKLRVLTEALRAKVVENVSGKILQAGPGKLAEQIKSTFSQNGDGMVGEVFVEPTDSNQRLKALALEYGGRGFYRIDPVNAKMLHYITKFGVEYFRYYVLHHPPSKEYRYLRSALAEMRGAVEDGLAAVVEEVLGRI
jgi:hypothetical protein